MSLSYRRVFVIFNPASGRGRGARRIGSYLKLLEKHLPFFDYGVTGAPGDEYELAERALQEGYDTLVAVGGDGTWSHVADRLLSSNREDVRFGVLPSGTGNDFGRALGLDYSDPEAAVRALVEGRVLAVDVGKVLTPSAPAGLGDDGQGMARPRHFLNVVGFGFDVAVIDAAATARFLKGELLYKVTALQQLFRFPGTDFALRDGSGLERSGTHLMATVSNGRFFGGGFPIAPLATVQDGLLHACLIGDAPPMTRMKLFNLAGKGRHVDSPRVEVHSAAEFSIHFEEPVRFEIDGDVFRASEPELRLAVLPGALHVVAP